MAYTVKAYALEKINLAPEDTTEEVLQNVAVILSTPKFSVPLERGLGLAQRFLDKPIPAAQSILISEVLEAIEEFEPRAEVENVTFELGDRPGMEPTVLMAASSSAGRAAASRPANSARVMGWTACRAVRGSVRIPCFQA